MVGPALISLLVPPATNTRVIYQVSPLCNDTTAQLVVPDNASCHTYPVVAYRRVVEKAHAGNRIVASEYMTSHHGAHGHPVTCRLVDATPLSGLK